MKKIFLIFTEFPPKYGGMQTHAFEMAKRLSQSYEVVVYTYKAIELKTEAELFDRQAPYKVKRILSRISFFSNIKKIISDIPHEKPQLIYSSTIYYGILREFIPIPIVCRSVGNDLLRPWIIYPFRFGSHLMQSSFMETIFNRIKKNIDKPPTIDIILKNIRIKLAKRCAMGAELILGNSEYTKSF